MTTGDSSVLITGGAGFIGAYVARALLDQNRTVCLYDIKGLSPESKFVLGDKVDSILIDEGSVDNWPRLFDVVRERRPKQIIHLATITNPVFLATNPLPALQINVGGTLNVLEAARQFEVERVVYFSSVGVLPRIQYEPIDAKHPIFLPDAGPGSGFYGASKVAGEALCFGYQQGFGLDFRIVRPSAVYGFGMQWPIYIKPMVEGAVRGETVKLGSGGPMPRDYTHVSDVARLAVAVLDAHPTADRIFYGATGQPLVTAAEAAQIVMDLVPGSRIEIADVLSDADRIELDYRGRISIENALQQLGWTPRYRSLRDGIAEYIERYRAFLALSRS